MPLLLRTRARHLPRSARHLLHPASSHAASARISVLFRAPQPARARPALRRHPHNGIPISIGARFSSINPIRPGPGHAANGQRSLFTGPTRIDSFSINFHFDSRTAITFVLAGQPELRELLKYATFAAVRQRIRISFHMLPMTLPETCTYIDHHTARCGRPTSTFADDAKADIHRHAGGLPRLVNALCYRSILHAAANDTRIIGSSNIVFR